MKNWTVTSCTLYNILWKSFNIENTYIIKLHTCIIIELDIYNKKLWSIPFFIKYMTVNVNRQTKVNYSMLLVPQLRRTYRSLVSAMYIIYKFIIDEYRKSTCPWKIQFSQSDRPNHYTSHNATWFVNWPIILLVSTPLCILKLPPHKSKEKHSHNGLYGIPSLAFFQKC